MKLGIGQEEMRFNYDYFDNAICHSFYLKLAVSEACLTCPLCAAPLEEDRALCSETPCSKFSPQYSLPLSTCPLISVSCWDRFPHVGDYSEAVFPAARLKHRAFRAPPSPKHYRAASSTSPTTRQKPTAVQSASRTTYGRTPQSLVTSTNSASQ